MSYFLFSMGRVVFFVVAVVCGGIFSLTPLSAEAVGNVTLAWDPSTSTNIVGYSIYYGTASTSYTNMIPVGNVTQLTVSNLAENVTYFFTATAFDSSGLESDFSAEVSYSMNISNHPPTLDPLLDITISENSDPQIINLFGISSGSTNENQTLSVTAFSSNPGLIPDPLVNYTSPDVTGSITIRPVAFQFGSALITVTVNDGGASNNVVSRPFAINVTSINQPPTISAIDNVVTPINTATAPIPFTIGDVETPGTNLILSASSDNTNLVPTRSISFAGSDTNRAVTITPLTNQTGIANITITVSDGTVNAGRTFQLNVLSGEANPPVLQPLMISNGVVTITWSAAPGRSYQVEYSLDLTSPTWTALGTPITATDAAMSTTDESVTEPQRFYRVSVLP